MVIGALCEAAGPHRGDTTGTGFAALPLGFAVAGGRRYSTDGKVRSVSIAAELEAKIVRHWKQHGQPNSAITSFRRALAGTTIRLPKGQAAHALRHTFASHFIQNGGNILTQQKILGHASLAVTMQYAHLLWLNDSGHPDRALSFAQP